MTDPRVITAAKVDEDAQYEAGLRPRTLDDYIGQDRVRENLQVSIAAARQRSEALDHVLLYGPPGLGKTTLAYVIANELGVSVRPTSGRSCADRRTSSASRLPEKPQARSPDVRAARRASRIACSDASAISPRS